MKKKDNICPFSIGDVFLQTYVISKRIKLRIPDTTQMKDLSKGFTGITNFNPFFLCYGSKERFKNPPFLLPPRLENRIDSQWKKKILVVLLLDRDLTHLGDSGKIEIDIRCLISFGVAHVPQ